MQAEAGGLIMRDGGALEKQADGGAPLLINEES